ncbi:hypothetical protein D3C87_687260 [compost metagenome]
MKTLEWDHYEFKVAGFYLAAMINGDYSGMSSDECMAYRTFERNAFAVAKESGLTVGHWSADSDECDNPGFTTCAVSGLYADCVLVKLMCYRAVEA